ncbi:bacteriocin-like protein [Chryseobacterium culicis]|uniref:bacteriocin-like protein n=1 Tax=Chryseobacterium culicis TaxID=680127 RepID=UPI001876CF5F|nr:hypothetical protein [Chryseobacterium culicis]MBE4947410.1 hypothetical protein [Chryseobacterium culicis]
MLTNNEVTMKNLKKISRKDLGLILGAAFRCDGCPAGVGYGPGADFAHSCEEYHALPRRCKSCVFVSSLCTYPEG